MNSDGLVARDSIVIQFWGGVERKAIEVAGKGRVGGKSGEMRLREEGEEREGELRMIGRRPRGGLPEVRKDFGNGQGWMERREDLAQSRREG